MALMSGHAKRHVKLPKHGFSPEKMQELQKEAEQNLPEGLRVNWTLREVSIFTDIDERSLALIDVFRVLSLSGDPVVVNICCMGGEIDAGVAVFDSMKAMKVHLTTRVIGAAYSAAAMIFQAGDHRQMTVNSQLMMHNGRVSFEEKETVTSEGAGRFIRDFNASNTRYQGVIAMNTGIDPKTVAAWCDREAFFSAKEALEARLCDEILLQWE